MCVCRHRYLLWEHGIASPTNSPALVVSDGPLRCRLPTRAAGSGNLRGAAELFCRAAEAKLGAANLKVACQSLILTASWFGVGSLGRTFRGHFSLVAYWGPQFDGSHSDFALQELMQFAVLQ